MMAGLGTHIDAPAHCCKNGKDVSSLQLSDLIAPLIVLDVSHKMTSDYAISVEDIDEFEARYGRIPENSFVLGYTGWGSKWPDVASYRNVGSDGRMQFPYFSQKAAAVLLERGVCGIGIDTLSPDAPLVVDNYPVHHLFLSAGKYIVENVAYVQGLSPVGMTALIMPLKIEGATEAPIRFIALQA